MTDDPLLPPLPKPAAAPERAVERLLRAAVGPIHAAYYLPRFNRFEQAERVSMSWNWAAGLLTLNWLLFRQLWLGALGYALALLLLPLLVLGLGRVLFQVPQSVEWGLWLTGAVLSVVLPGAGGNALFYARCQRRIGQALAASPTLDDACQRLMQQSSNNKHAIWLGLANAAVLALAVLAYMYFSATPPAEPQVSAPAQGKVEATRLPTPQPASAPALAATPASAIAPASAATPASATAPASAIAPASAATLASATASAFAAAPASVTASAAASAAPAQAAVAQRPAASRPARVVSAAQQPVSLPARPAAPAASAANRVVPARAAASAKPAASKPLTAVSDAAATDPVFINVGLFADADNARRAYVKLVLAGLPAERRVLMPAPGSGKGKLTRVRAGPFASRAQALAAVPNIKELELDAVIAP